MPAPTLGWKYLVSPIEYQVPHCEIGMYIFIPHALTIAFRKSLTLLKVEYLYSTIGPPLAFALPLTHKQGRSWGYNSGRGGRLAAIGVPGVGTT